MIKAQELRIGNLVMNQTGELKDIPIGEPHAIDLDDFKGWYEFYVPILLTEDWLLKAGFEKISTNYQKEWLLLWGNLKTNTIDFVLNEPYSNKRKVTQLIYVHQLQNIWHALTGTEIEFK